MRDRVYTPVDRMLIGIQRSLRTVMPPAAHTASRPYPATGIQEAHLEDSERKLAGRLMRVNHAGEVAAQALYQGQGLTGRDPDVRRAMAVSAQEEIDHLAWCETRLAELDTPTSRLDPFWFLGSFAIGFGAGLLGDAFSLGFVAETEHQVVEHLQGHLARLPAHDTRSRAVVEQMQKDEAHHGDTARRAGGRPMPAPVRAMMRLTAKVMTGTAYWI
ncbi:MAG TPA: 2-polyprenyl-3-methyl-6-methoxy-1,4-benzoquinone monooxygenase [Gammaproteobacteria bacterium]|nr:2-polyprenyl-3-methyl-6-methoxy-1,4-benzoquinone monooxygenase [Gammaproteobacteria bacterium]